MTENTHHSHWTGAEGSISRNLIKLALPIIAVNLLQVAYQLTDAFWVGRIGADAVASVSVSFPITFFLVSLSSGFMIAGSALVAQYVGAKNHAKVNHVVAQTFDLVVFSSFILALIGWFFSSSILKYMSVTPEVAGNALLYLRMVFLGLPFMMIFALFQSALRGVGQVKVPMFIILGTTTLNFLLDPLFIFGWKSIPAFGVSGAALATFFTQFIAASLGLFFLFRGSYVVHLKLSHFRVDMSAIKKLFFLGIPSSLEQSIRSLGILVMTFLITSFGTVTTAVYGVGSNLLQVMVIPALGISMASSVLVGHNLGAGKVERAHDTAVLSAFISFSFLTLVGALCFFFATPLVRFFVPSDPRVIEQGTLFVRIMSLSFGFLGMQMSLSGVFRASGNMMIPLMFSIVSLWIFQFPSAYILSKHTSLGAVGIWWAFPFSYIATALVAVIWFRKGDWKRKRLIEEETATEVMVESENALAI